MSHSASLIYGTPVVYTPLVSIVIPTYKRPGLLREAMESALAQRECSSYEIIVIDNDQSSKILEVVSYLSPQSIAVYQNSANIGMWGSMRRGFRLAKGEWILVLCDDDLLMPSAIQAFERIVFPAIDRNIGCIAGGVELLLDDQIKPIIVPRRIQLPLAESMYCKETLIRIENDMRLHNVPKLCASFFRREYIKKLRGWDEECCGFADLALVLRIQREKQLFSCMEIFGTFRVHNGNESHPTRIWNNYPINAGRRLLSCYVDEETQIGESVRDMVERTYISALWKGLLTDRQRRMYAEELLESCVQDPSRRFLLRTSWLLRLLGLLYMTLRPGLGRLAQLIGRRAPRGARTWRYGCRRSRDILGGE